MQEIQQKYEQEMKAVHKELEPLLAPKKDIRRTRITKNILKRNYHIIDSIPQYLSR
jgi:hypothetical protein